jgi:HEAT repeat protein
MIDTRMLLLVLSMPLILGCRDSVELNAQRVASLVKTADYAELGTLLSHEDLDLRCRAAKALSWVHSAKASEEQQRVLTVTGCKWKLRSEAAWRLMEEKAPRWQAMLLPLLKDSERGVRWNVAKILGFHGNAQAMLALTACVVDSDLFVAAWCKWAGCKLRQDAGCKKPNMDLRDGKTGP